MKKTVIVIFAIILAVMLASCADKKTPAPNNEQENSEDIAKLFEQSRTEAELCYISAFGCEDFDSYLFAFQDEAVRKAAEKSGVDYDTFVSNVVKGLEANCEVMTALYGDGFQVGYAMNQEEAVEGEQFDALISTLREYGVDTSLVKKAVKGYYSYTIFSYGEKKVNEDGSPEYEFGEIPEGAELLYSAAFDLVLYYVDNGEDGGWFVSPEQI